MIEALASAFPEFPPYGGAFEEVIPHVTLVETSDREMWTRVEEWFEPELPLMATVRTFSIYEQTNVGWVEKYPLPLGKPPPKMA